MNSIFALLTGHRLATGIAVAVLAVGAAAGAFASQDKFPGQHPAASHAALHSHKHNDADATAVPDATEVPDANETPRAIKGIPTTNPHFVPDVDGTCTAGESAVKTTPSGIEVNVPCHAAAKSGNAHGKGDLPAPAQTAHATRPGDDQPDDAETPEPTEAPDDDRESNATATATAAATEISVATSAATATATAD